MPKQAHARTNRKNTQLPKRSSGKDLPLSNSGRAINAEDERDLDDARRALKESQQKGSIPWEQVKRELGI
jgi:hypothetical protein